MKLTRGFTLIELSITLVIIGLIVGGVLVGQDLISAAQIRAQITQVERMQAAVLTFKLKYNGLPGDLPNATQFFGAGSQPEQVTNGNGNGMIDAVVSQPCGGCADGFNDMWWYSTAYESVRVMDHLAAAGLLELAQYDETNVSNLVQGIAYPRMRYTSKGTIHLNHYSATNQGTDGGLMLGYQIPDADNPAINIAGHVLRFHMRQAINGGQTVYAGIPSLQPWDAMNIDKKIDDGFPQTGRVFASRDYAAYDNTICAEIASNTYRTRSNLVASWGNGIELGCGLSVKAGF